MSIEPEKKLPQDVTDKIIHDFGKEQYLDACELMNSGQELSDRVKRCVIYLACGDFEKLKQYSESAKRDYRDVIYWAEYAEGEDKSEPRRVRDFNKPFGQTEL